MGVFIWYFIHQFVFEHALFYVNIPFNWGTVTSCTEGFYQKRLYNNNRGRKVKQFYQMGVFSWYFIRQFVSVHVLLYVNIPSNGGRLPPVQKVYITNVHITIT